MTVVPAVIVWVETGAGTGSILAAALTHGGAVVVYPTILSGKHPPLVNCVSIRQNELGAKLTPAHRVFWASTQASTQSTKVQLLWKFDAK